MMKKEQNLQEPQKQALNIPVVRVSCPKCGGTWIGDIGYDIWQCFNCDETWKQKSKTGLESN